MNANDDQVGGKHYSSEYQHWDYVEDTKLPYLLAQISRYVIRWRKKNGLEDLRKAVHYVIKQREVHEANRTHYLKLTEKFIRTNKLAEDEELVLNLIVDYHLGSLAKLDTIHTVLLQILAALEGHPATLKIISDPTFREDGDEWKR